MGLISTIKSLLGMDDSHDRRSQSSGTDVTVERETDATTERAVKESDEGATGASTDGESNGVPDTAAESSDDTSTDEIAGATDVFDTDTDATEETGDDATSDGGEGSSDGDPVDDIKGIGPAYAERLADAGVSTVPELADADAAELDDATGIGENRIQGWIDRANARS